ncbi:aminotransferase [Undibacter mobilis]|uniref:Aminotransferase class III-fold pyridoxal phosphate-dependent enzyme n=1 Tax=Undibacter mobilis TaxID=2292256 RepID=A0A371BDE3_9BRAD|nr:aminotransferase [Undibacter mobilis]RDV05626.1 aminotransferase class III-fold pyridoxal phosphate-dependent enzyme [Undibacter mobilis]
MACNMGARDIETLVHPFTNLSKHRQTGPMILDHGKGIYLFDDAGKKYIDGLAGLWCTSLGFGNEELIEASTAQMRKLPFASMFTGKSHELAIELAEKLKEIAPGPASKVLFSSGGSDANDMQVKLTWYYNNARGLPKKKKIISRMRAYHGITVASGSLTGLPPVHADFDLPIGNVAHTSCPDFYRGAAPGETEEEFSARMARELDELIQREGPDTVACFIAEPIMGAGGVVIPPASYFPKIHDVLAAYDVRIVSDEVICGFGRTGNWFGSQSLGMKPSSISVAKAITSGYFPLGAITIEEPLYQAMIKESEKIGVFAHGFTYTGHPVGCAIALKTIEIYQRDRIVERVRKLAPLFAERVKRLGEHELVGNTRSLGLIGGVELVADRNAKRLFTPNKGVGMYCIGECQRLGLITRAIGDTIAICPPLIINEAEINELFDTLDAAIRSTEDWVTKNKHRAA